MQKKYLMPSGSLDSYDSGSESDASDTSMRSCKRVQFSGGVHEADTTSVTGNINETGKRMDKERHHHGNNKMLLNMKGNHTNGFSIQRIDRGDIPDGSDVFRQVLKEIQSASDDEVCTPRSECDTPTKPLKSILKKHK